MSESNSSGTAVASGGFLEGLSAVDSGGQLEVNSSPATINLQNDTVSFGEKSYKLNDVLGAIINRGIVGGTDGSDIAGQPITVGGKVTTAGAAIEAAAKTGGGTGGSVVTLKYGDNFLPRGISTDMNVTAPMAAMTLAGSGPLADIPGAHIIVDPMTLYQEFVGTGGALTASSAYVLMNYLTEAELDALLEEVFVTNGQNCLRVCFGSSDYTYQTYQTYDDVSTDGTWSHFSIAMDEEYVIPILQKIIQKNPGIWLVGASWTPPAYLKTNKSLIGGNFVSNATNNLAYANYHVLVLQEYAKRGIYFSMLSGQNEPQSISTVYPSCGWTAAALAAFYPVLRTQMDLAGFDNVGILAGDCNWGDVENYTSGLTAGSQALASVDGVALHGYDDNVVTAQPTMRLLGKDWYHTEWITFTNANDVTWLNTIAADLCVASVRAGAKALVMWNVFLDQNGAPVEEQILGTWECRPLIAVQNDKSGTITRNLEYYLFSHLMRFVQRGARVMRSNSFAVGTPIGPNNWQHSNVSAADVENVAFLNPDGTRIVFVLNPLTTNQTVTITDSQTGTSFVVTLAPQSAFTFVWGAEDIIDTAIEFTAPGAPTLATPGQNASGQVTVGITPPSSIGSTAISVYRIYDADNPDEPLYVIPGAATSFTDTLLTTGSVRSYYATAVGGGGESAKSNTVTGTPPKNSDSFTMKAAATGSVGAAIPITLAANNAGPAADVVVTLSDSGAGGTFSPATATLKADSTVPVQVTYTGVSAAGVTISATNNGSLANPEAIEITLNEITPYLAATAEGAGAVTTGTAKAIAGNVVECFVDCELDSYVNASVFSLLVGNYPTSGAAWNNSQFNLLIGTGGQVIVQYYDVNKVYCYSIASLPASLSGRVMFHSVANISTTDSYTDKLGNVIPASGIVIQVSQDGGKTYATCTAVRGHASTYGSINPGSALNQMAAGHLAENAGKIFSAVVYDSTGAAIWSPDFTKQTAGATTFTDAESNAWTVDTGASITSG